MKACGGLLTLWPRIAAFLYYRSDTLVGLKHMAFHADGDLEAEIIGTLKMCASVQQREKA